MSGLLDGGDDEPDDSDEGDDLLGDDDGLLGDDLGFDEEDDGESENELTYRLDEVEKEIDSLENQVETVRGENEKISDSVSTVERNVDKLVDLYEIVTQGINPFVGDQEIGNAFETAANQDGLGPDTDDDIDEGIADADAEEFLDDDPMLDDENLVDEEFDPADEGDDEFEDETVDEEAMDDTVDDGDDELPTDAAFEDDPDEENDPESPVPAAERGVNGEIDDPPYLATHPSGNDAELVTLDWMRFLVEAAGIDGAAQTIAYYESIGWISEPVETYLRSMVNGFGDESTVPDDDPQPRSVLSTTEHKRSLQYIAWIATPEKEPEIRVVERPPERWTLPRYGDGSVDTERPDQRFGMLWLPT